MTETTFAVTSSTPGPLYGHQSKPTATTPGVTEADLPVWSDESGNNVGYWECTPGRFTAVRDGYTEVCQVLVGRATIHPVDGAPFDLGAGDALVMPNGWSGEWEVHETLRKLYVIISTPTA